jgi:hypothetical protein
LNGLPTETAISLQLSAISICGRTTARMFSAEEDLEDLLGDARQLHAEADG